MSYRTGLGGQIDLTYRWITLSHISDMDWILCVNFAWISGATSGAVMHQSLVVVSNLLNSLAPLFVARTENPRVGPGTLAGLGVGVPNHPDRFFAEPAAPGHHKLTPDSRANALRSSCAA